MNREEFLNLKRGDIVQNIGSGQSYVIESVSQNKGSFIFLGIRTCSITNPAEWKLVPSSTPGKGITKEEIAHLRLGVYRVYWIDSEQHSVGVIYCNQNGTKFLHCSNWINPPLYEAMIWDSIQRLELIEEQR
jgi:hypothetical protein